MITLEEYFKRFGSTLREACEELKPFGVSTPEEALEIAKNQLKGILLMKRVIMESPFSGDVAKNILYARACMLDCFRRGEAPFASHLLYPQVLDDNVPVDRSLGMEAGFLWMQMADYVVVYQDNGISSGMRDGIARAEQYGKPVEYRKLPNESVYRIPT
jgi:hypothetical protein